MSKERIIKPNKDFIKSANINTKNYLDLYNQSIKSPEKFWADQAERLTWFKKWNKVLSHDFKNAKVKWFEGGKLNVSYNCIDRHLNSSLKNKAALIWEGDHPDESRVLTYYDLYREVNKAANVLKKLGVKKGDRVLIYLPMIPELAISCLACTRIGAVHSVVFGGFSPEALQGRIEDCKPKLIITSDGGYRGGKSLDLKRNIDISLENSKQKV
jgi:acetyl-CoA synthetase